jgi:hypothetical protein
MQRSYWRLAKTAIEIQLTLHEYAMQKDDSGVDQRLQEFVDGFFSSLSPQDTDVMANAANGLTTPLRAKV